MIDLAAYTVHLIFFFNFKLFLLVSSYYFNFIFSFKLFLEFKLLF